MALDKMMSEPLLNGYKFYLDDLDNKKITGEYYDEVTRLFNRIKEIADSVDTYDTVGFYAKMQDENIVVKISEAYTRALSSNTNSNNGQIADDMSLLKSNLDALRQGISTLRQNYEQQLSQAHDDISRRKLEKSNNPAKLIEGIEKMIALGEQPDMTYPRFLKIQIEQGLDKAMEGHVMLVDALINQVEELKTMVAPPLEIAKAEAKLLEYKHLASRNEFGYVEINEWNLALNKIDKQFAPQIAKSEAKYNLFCKIMNQLDDWSLSYCPFAPTIMPWVVLGDEQKSKENVAYTQATAPGIMKEYEKLLMKYFNLHLSDIYADELFVNSINSSMQERSSELIQYLINDVYPQCNPFKSLPQNLIEKRTDMYKGKREVNQDYINKLNNNK